MANYSKALDRVDYEFWIADEFAVMSFNVCATACSMLLH